MAENPRPATLSDDDLLQLIARHEKDALGSPIAAGATVGAMYGSAAKDMTTLQIDRFDALQTYWARPMGNEVEGSSTVVLPELRDSLEWIAAQLMRVFDEARVPAVFEPENEDDIDTAQLETEAVRHVFLIENDGHTVIQDYIKDALLLRNGYIKVWWDPTAQHVTERYTGLTQDELSMLLGDRSDEEVKVIEQAERQVDMPAGMPPMTVFDVTLRVRKSEGRVCVRCIAPEDVLVSSKARSANLDSCPFLEHKTTKTRSELIAEGFDASMVNALEAGRPRWLDIDALARDIVTEQLSINEDESDADRSMQEIDDRDVTMLVDYDGDGIAELRQIRVLGDKIASNDEIEEVPMASGCAKRMPHRHTGISLYDELADIQVIKSQLAREGLNNLRLANNPRTFVDWKNCNLADLMVARAGGVVRVNGQPGAVAQIMEHPSNLMQQIVPMLQELDRWREFRLGIGRDTLGLDPDALQDVTATSHLAGMSSASLKLEMMARCLAEGLRDCFVKVRNLLVRHQKQPMFFRLRGKFVEVDPTSWRPERSTVTVNVGLGSGNRPEQRQNLMMLANAQKELAAVGLVGPKQAYESFRLLADTLGFDQPERFAMDPDSAEFQQFQAQHPPQPPPQLLAAQERTKQVGIQAQATVAKAQMAEQGASQRAQAEVAHAALQNREDRMVEGANMDVQLFTNLAKILAQIVSSQLKQDPAVNAGAVLRQDVQSLAGKA